MPAPKSSLRGVARDKGNNAVADIRKRTEGARVSFEQLDLASLASIAAFAERIGQMHPHLDLLINNAGVMALPQRRQTADGFELQLGTNFLGPFALTGQLLPLLRAAPAPRVVTVSSIAARNGAISLDDLQSTLSYTPMGAYGQSKLADLMFALELHRRSTAGSWGLTSIAAHPGIARTELLANGAGPTSWMAVAGRILGPLMFQSAAQGALPTLFAATSPDAVGGSYYGPAGRGEMRGAPSPAKYPGPGRRPRRRPAPLGSRRIPHRHQLPTPA